MPTAKINGAEIYYESHGDGPETVVFAHGLLWSGRMFEAQVATLRDRYRCVTLDWRGQGQSEVTASGYDMETLADDAVALLEHLQLPPCHFVGLSMGGFVGMRLAARRPELLKSLVLLSTSADAEPRENVSRYRMLNFITRWTGFRLVMSQVMSIMFGRKFLSDPARAKDRETWKARLLTNDRIGVTRAVAGVIDRKSVYEELAKIRVPTLILVGDQDVATDPTRSTRMHERIAGAEMTVIVGSGHTATMEEPGAVNAALAAFFQRVSSAAARAV